MKKIGRLIVAIIAMVSINQTKVRAQDEDKVYNFVAIENPPKYPGGMESFYTFLGKQIVYPKQAVADNVQGFVYVSFTIEKDGSLNDIKVDRKLGAGTDEEAIRVLKLANNWIPGSVNGKNVRVKYNLPIRFKLPNTPAKATPQETPKENNSSNDRDSAIYTFVSMETPPTYPGGMEAFYKLLGENIKYPPMAAENNIQGSVYLSFTVERDGSLTDIKVNRKLGYGTDEEAVRVFKLSKRWNPGMQNGKTVRVNYSLPIKFNLSN